MSIEYFCFDGDPANNVAPHRPSLDDVGGDSIEDFPGQPTDPRYWVTDKDENQRNQLLHGMAKVTPATIISVRFSGGAPFIYKHSQVRTSDATLTPADNGVGDTTITWAANSFPPELVEPRVSINGPTPGMASVELVANGVHVVTLDSSGAAADLPFTVEL